MKPTKAILALILPLLLLAACGHPKGNHTFDPSQVAFSAQYNTLFDGQLYPSMILAATSQPADYFSISLTAPADNCVLRLVVDSSALNYVTFFQEILPKKGEKYTFSPSLKWTIVITLAVINLNLKVFLTPS